jgi:sarcosine oxidase
MSGANTSHLAAQVEIYTPPMLAHHVRFTFNVDGGGWQSWIDKPRGGVGTYQHQAGPSQWAVGGHVDPSLTAWEVGPDAAIEASRVALLEYVRARLTVDPTIVESVYCTTVPNLGDGVSFRRNGPVLAVHGDNLMKRAPALGRMVADAVMDGSTPSPDGR